MTTASSEIIHNLEYYIDNNLLKESELTALKEMLTTEIINARNRLKIEQIQKLEDNSLTNIMKRLTGYESAREVPKVPTSLFFHFVKLRTEIKNKLNLGSVYKDKKFDDTHISTLESASASIPGGTLTGNKRKIRFSRKSKKSKFGKKNKHSKRTRRNRRRSV